MNRKGQSATEYLMTYGWAILAIAIVGALLYTQVFSESAANRHNTTVDSMGIDAVNLCMANCMYDQGVSKNHYISDSDKCNMYAEIMTDSGVSQNIITEYKQICLEQSSKGPRPTEYDSCIKACFDDY